MFSQYTVQILHLFMSAPSACYIAETQESNTLKYFCLNAVMLGLILPPRPQQNGVVVNQQGHHYCDFVPIFVEAAP